MEKTLKAFQAESNKRLRQEVGPSLIQCLNFTKPNLDNIANQVVATDIIEESLQSMFSILDTDELIDVTAGDQVLSKLQQSLVEVETKAQKEAEKKEMAMHLLVDLKALHEEINNNTNINNQAELLKAEEECLIAEYALLSAEVAKLKLELE